MVAEVLIYVPSIANFRLNWLNDRLAAAHTAALVLDAAPSGMVPESLAQADPRQHRRPRGGDEDGQRAPSARASPTCRPQVDARHRHAQRRPGGAPSSTRSTRCCSPSRTTSCAWSGRRRWAASQFLEIVLDEAPLRKAMCDFSGQHSAAVADDLRHHRDAGVLRAALSAGAADGAHHRQHDRLPRRSGKSDAHHRRIGPRRRNRHRRRRARRHAARARLDAASEEPAGRARSRGVEDQSRSAQSAGLGAACSPTSFRACPIPRCSASRPS